jgi:D-alanyl-D-alanine carboxypeptidase (penicillin-binding protein 5/6)
LNLFKKKDIVKTVHVVSGKKDVIQLVADSDVDIPVADGEKDKFQTLIDAPERIYAPVGKGDPVGKVKIMYNGKEVASANLIAKESVDKRSFFSTVYQTISLAVSYIKNTLV